jgi:hypothetical protein
MLETLPMWSNVQPQLQPHPRCMIMKLGNHLEGSRRTIGGFSNLVFGRPNLVPGTTPNMFFMLSVTPTNDES